MEPNLPTQTTVFVPRLKPPGPNERYWINTNYGGLSPCILPDTSGSYGYKRGSTLPNCFAAGTEVVTDEGVKQIQNLVGKTVNVYCIDNQWHPATFNCYGQQEIHEITFNNGHTYKCTANHRWPVMTQSGRLKGFFSSDSLYKNNIIPLGHRFSVEFDEDELAIKHGFIFGDGSVGYKERYTCAALCGDKRLYMYNYFKNDKHYVYSDGTIEVPYQVPYGKQLPSITQSDKYLYNFLKGYFAADGCVDEDGCCSFSCKSADTLNYIRDICFKIGIMTTPVRTAYCEGFGKMRYLSTLTIRRFSLTPNFFLNPKHKSRFESRRCKSIKSTYFKSLKSCNVIDFVYCCNEPITHTFMLVGGEFTGNCVGYAWGRFYEILGSRPTLSTGNAGVWYSYTADGYQRSQTPQLGAVACWSKPGEAGHVAIVEQINQDGSIVISQSGWNWTPSRHAKAVETATTRAPTWLNWSGYHFQGFIYNPAAKGLTDKLGQFLKEAESHIGEHGDWTWRVSGLGRGQPWCAAFVNAVAKTVGGLVNVIFPQSYGAGDYPRIGVPRYGGQWLPGPAQGKYPTPQAGDLILFRWDPPSAYAGQDTYFSDHIGIVKKVDSNSVYTIEGNTGTYDNNTSYVKAKSYSLRYSCINGYFRPDWAKVGASAANQVGALIGPLYDSENTRKDALLREIGYVNSSNLPSIQSSHIHLSAMNYTFLLNSLYEFGAPQLAGSASGIISNVDASNLEEVPRAIFEFLTQNGLSPAASVGILANIQGECGFNIGAVNSIGASGMCQWLGGRKEAMIKMAGPNWKTNLTGQCQYLWSELTQNSYYKSRVYTPMTEVPNTLDGALHAMNIFLHKFEIPCVHGAGNPLSTTCSEYRRRSPFCTDLWNKLIPIVSA